MKLRKYLPTDGPILAKLYYDTVHTINAKDYSGEQLHAWATGDIDLEEWNRSFLEHNTVVAVDHEVIVGFGDMDMTGYLDRLYVHKDYQNKGIATAICDVLETQICGEKITTHASVTAVSFFKKRGYQIVKEQNVERKGVLLTNYIMEKVLFCKHPVS